MNINLMKIQIKIWKNQIVHNMKLKNKGNYKNIIIKIKMLSI